MLPVVALVGRPNVGKSTLFNRLTRTRDALVADFPGLTRDRKYGQANYEGLQFIVVDTGGISGEEQGIDAGMAEQSLLAMDEADIVLFVVDCKSGIVAADYTIAEKNKQYLEGTGSMVLDRINKKVYSSISERTSEILIDEFCEDFNYMPIVFKSYQSHENVRKLIYHTNVMMCIAYKYSIICLDSIDCNIEKNKVFESLKDDGKEIIEINSRQLNSFAGNMIELVYNNQSYLVMSASAYESLSKEQIIKINKYSQIIFSDVSTIEYCGGGSVRCMIAEIFN